MLNKILIFQQQEASFFDIFLSQLPIFLIFLVLYYFFLRPNSKKQESIKSMQANLSKGDKIVTIGGIHGKVVRVRNEKVIIRVSNDGELTVDKTAIAKLLNSDN